MTMKGFFQHGSTIFAYLELNSIRGEQGLGFYRLIAHITIEWLAWKEKSPLLITHFIGSLSVNLKGGSSIILGRMNPQYSTGLMVTHEDAYDESIYLDLELDQKRIEAIEEIRAGEDIHFNLKLNGIAYYRFRKEYPFTIHASLQYRANQSAWLEILEQMGYMKTLLLEIPMMDSENSSYSTETIQYLETAHKHLLKGHYREAVGACRDVLESLNLSAQEKQIPDLVKPLFENSRSMNKEKRMSVIYNAVKLITHPARHADDISANIEWGMNDARGVIIMVTALIQMISSQREEMID